MTCNTCGGALVTPDEVDVGQCGECILYGTRSAGVEAFDEEFDEVGGEG